MATMSRIIRLLSGGAFRNSAALSATAMPNSEAVAHTSTKPNFSTSLASEVLRIEAYDDVVLFGIGPLQGDPHAPAIFFGPSFSLASTAGPSSAALLSLPRRRRERCAPASLSTQTCSAPYGQLTVSSWGSVTQVSLPGPPLARSLPCTLSLVLTLSSLP